MYVVVANEVSKLSRYILNRPGRFHYHLRFTYPTESDIREYLHDACGEVSAENMDAVLRLTNLVPLNYDHLRAIALEINMGSVMSDVINDLNIKPALAGTVPVAGTLTVPDGQVFEVTGEIHRDGDNYVQLEETDTVIRFASVDCAFAGSERICTKYEIMGMDTEEEARYMGGVITLQAQPKDIYAYPRY